MMVTAIVFLLFAGFYLGLLILLIVLAVNAKTTAVRIGSIVVGLFLLLILPLAILSATYTFRSTSS